MNVGYLRTANCRKHSSERVAKEKLFHFHHLNFKSCKIYISDEDLQDLHYQCANRILLVIALKQNPVLTVHACCLYMRL